MYDFLVALAQFGLVVWVLAVAWLAFSWQRVFQEEVAQLEVLGKLREDVLTSDNGLFGSGLHFVPFLFGLIRLRKYSTKTRLLAHQAENGTAFEIRTKERLVDDKGVLLPVADQRQAVKCLLDATGFWNPPFRDGKALKRLVQNGVPMDEENLAPWVFSAVSTNISDICGGDNGYTHTEIRGGAKNKEITQRLRAAITEPSHLFRRIGIFGDDPDVKDEGTGVFELKVEFIHLPPALSAAIDEAAAVLQESIVAEARAEANRKAAEVQVKTAKLEAEAAESVARNKAKVIGQTIDEMLDSWFNKEVKRMGLDPSKSDDVKKAREALDKNGAYARKEQELDLLRQREMAGGGSFNRQEIDINSGGQPLKDAGLAAFVGAAAAWLTGKGDDGGSGKGGSKKETSAETRERLKKKYGEPKDPKK